jgi:hypothetical protein
MGWTWDYLNNGIPWAVVQRIMFDAPSYGTAEEREDKENIKVTKENVKDVAKYLNSLV